MSEIKFDSKLGPGLLGTLKTSNRTARIWCGFGSNIDAYVVLRNSVEVIKNDGTVLDKKESDKVLCEMLNLYKNECDEEENIESNINDDEEEESDDWEDQYDTYY